MSVKHKTGIQITVESHHSKNYRPHSTNDR